MDTCPDCKGCGEIPTHYYDKWHTCQTCKGKGEIGEPDEDALEMEEE